MLPVRKPSRGYLRSHQKLGPNRFNCYMHDELNIYFISLRSLNHGKFQFRKEYNYFWHTSLENVPIQKNPVSAPAKITSTVPLRRLINAI